MSLTSIGLPKLFIAFEAAARAANNRAKRGYVAVIVRDTNKQGVHLLQDETLIPADLGQANIEHIKTAFQGSDRGVPSLVVLLVIAPGTDDTTALEAGLKLIERYSVDYIAPPPDMTDEESAKLLEWTLAQRALYRTPKLVRPFKTTGADNIGVIELDETGMKSGNESVTAAGYCARIAGILAGIPMAMSSTYAPLPELTAVTARTTSEINDAIDAGKLILIHDGVQAKIARGVNSMQEIPEGGKEDWRKIKIVEAMDLITYFLRTTIEGEYIGKYANTYDNKQILVAAILSYFQYLEREGVLNPGESFAEVDYEAQYNWLRANGVDVSTLTRQQILEYQTGTWVFIRCGGRIVDAMEDFKVKFSNL